MTRSAAWPLGVSLTTIAASAATDPSRAAACRTAPSLARISPRIQGRQVAA